MNGFSVSSATFESIQHSKCMLTEFLCMICVSEVQTGWE